MKFDYLVIGSHPHLRNGVGRDTKEKKFSCNCRPTFKVKKLPENLKLSNFLNLVHIPTPLIAVEKSNYKDPILIALWTGLLVSLIFVCSRYDN